MIFVLKSYNTPIFIPEITSNEKHNVRAKLNWIQEEYHEFQPITNFLCDYEQFKLS